MKIIKDKRGVSEEIFKLALIVIVIAAVLSILAGLLSGVKDSANESVNAVDEGMESMAKKTACEMKDGIWDSETGTCNY